jgi:hypothetical protein
MPRMNSNNNPLNIEHCFKIFLKVIMENKNIQKLLSIKQISFILMTLNSLRDFTIALRIMHAG